MKGLWVFEFCDPFTVVLSTELKLVGAAECPDAAEVNVAFGDYVGDLEALEERYTVCIGRLC